MPLFLVFLLLWSFTAGLNVRNTTALSATINLDAPAKDRYRDVCTRYKALMTTNLQEMWDQLIPHLAQPIIDILPLEGLIPADMQDELEGMFSCLNFTSAQQFVFNFFYEFVAHADKSQAVSTSQKMCTTIVAWSEKQHRIIHGHNLDFSFSKELRNIAIDYSFTKNGSVVYKCASLLGTVTFEHCMAPGKFAISINERDDGSLRTNIADILKKRNEVSYSLGKIITQSSYKSALAMAQSILLDAPVYYILSGKDIDEGAVVTRNGTETVDTWTLDTTNGRWFILETNYDHWLPPPADDDRRDPGNKHMSALDGSCSLQEMFEVLSMEPTLRNRTVWTGVCSATTDDYEIVIRTPVV